MPRGGKRKGAGRTMITWKTTTSNGKPRGGKREGAGRKPLPDSERKQVVCVRMSPLMVEYLRWTGDIPATVTRAVETSPRYKRWLAKQDTSGR